MSKAADNEFLAVFELRLFFCLLILDGSLLCLPHALSWHIASSPKHLARRLVLKLVLFWRLPATRQKRCYDVSKLTQNKYKCRLCNCKLQPISRGWQMTQTERSQSGIAIFLAQGSSRRIQWSFFNPHVQCCVVFTCLSAIQHASCAPFTTTTCRNKLEQFHSWLDWLSQPRVYDTNIGKSWINMSSLRRASPFSTLACQASPMHRNRRGCVKRLQETSPNKFVSFLCNKIICS